MNIDDFPKPYIPEKLPLTEIRSTIIQDQEFLAHIIKAGRKLSEYIEDIRKSINTDVKVNYGAKDYYPHQPMHLVADLKELTDDTGWKPASTFMSGIAKLL